MNNTDAQDYREAAELIASEKQTFCCLALENKRDNPYKKGVGRPDLAKGFADVFNPFKEERISESVSSFVFWNEDTDAESITKTNSPEHSRECRVFALLLIAEMIENP